MTFLHEGGPLEPDDRKYRIEFTTDLSFENILTDSMHQKLSPGCKHVQ